MGGGASTVSGTNYSYSTISAVSSPPTTVLSITTTTYIAKISSVCVNGEQTRMLLTTSNSHYSGSRTTAKDAIYNSTYSNCLLYTSDAADE